MEGLSHGADGACLKSLSLRHRAGPDGDADWHILADVNGSREDSSSQASSSPWERKKGRETERARKERNRNRERERERARGGKGNTESGRPADGWGVMSHRPVILKLPFNIPRLHPW